MLFFAGGTGSTESNVCDDVYNTCSNTWGTMKLTIAPYDCAEGTAGARLLMGRNELVEYKEGLLTAN